MKEKIIIMFAINIYTILPPSIGLMWCFCDLFIKYSFNALVSRTWVIICFLQLGETMELDIDPEVLNPQDSALQFERQ